MPGLLIGVLSFGYLPALFIPAGPMGLGLRTKKSSVSGSFLLRVK